MTPLISVIVPVYKAEAYLEACVRSVFAQTYTNWELILVENGSPDGCPALCDALAREDARVRVLHKGNNGVSAARNAGLALARGEFVHFVDSDDRILPEMLQTLYAALAECDADLALCGFFTVGDAASRDVGAQSLPYTVFPSPQALAQACLDADFSILFGGVWAKLYRRALLEEYGIRFPEDMSLCEDNAFNFLYYARVRRAVLLPAQLYAYMLLPGSLTVRFRPDLPALYSRIHALRSAYIAPFSLPQGQQRLNALYLGWIFGGYGNAARAALPRRARIAGVRALMDAPGVAEALASYAADPPRAALIRRFAFLTRHKCARTVCAALALKARLRALRKKDGGEAAR